MTELSLVPPALGLVGLIAAFIIYALVKRYDEGDEAIRKIADAIHTGAMVFMRREYSMVGVVRRLVAGAAVLFRIGRGDDLGLRRRGIVLGWGWLDRHVHGHQGQCPHHRRRPQPRAGGGAVRGLLRRLHHGLGGGPPWG